MAYRVLIGNVPIECDSIDEALEIARRASGETVQGVRANGMMTEKAEGSRWTEKRVSDFLGLVEGKQRKLLDTLMEHADGRTHDQLCQVLTLDDGRKLGGVFTGLWKNAKKVGADPGDLYIKRPATIGGRRVQEYFLADSFRRIASKIIGRG